MKRIGNSWAAITDFANLHEAYRLARRGKGGREEVARFAFQLERHLLRLQWELQNGCYRPGDYRLFTLYERKPRRIAAAPFRDRVVHHAVMQVIEPPLDRRFIHDSYACRKGKGVHAAVDRYQHWAGRYAYVMQLDIKAYFPSIDRRLLKSRLRHDLKDIRTLDLLDSIIDGGPHDERAPPGCGIPIGNLTSQFFANLYLNRLDHCIKQRLGVRAYLRYVDDLVLLSNDKNQLHAWCDAITDSLRDNERLALHPARITPTRLGIDLFGYRVWPGKRRLRNDNGHRFARKHRKRARRYAEGRLELADFQPSMQAWIGHAQHGETEGLRRALFSGTVFRRGD